MLVARFAPVDAVEADHPRDRAVEHDRGLQAVVVGHLAAGGTDELQRVGGGAAERYPRQPRLEVRAVAVDEREQLFGVRLLRQAQVPAPGQLAAQHRYVATVSAPSSSLIATSIE